MIPHLRKFLPVLLLSVWAFLASAEMPQSIPVAAAADQPAIPMSMLDLYAENRRQGRPNYVTADLLLLGYALVRRATLADLEDLRLRPAFADLIQGLSQRLPRGLDQALNADPIGTANRRYLELLSALLSGDSSRLVDPVQAEYKLVVNAAGIAPSALFERPLDFSQFTPRGRYTGSDELARYFRAMRYAGAVPFLVQPSPATGTSSELAARMTAQALQLVRLIADDPDLQASRLRLDELLAWQFGPTEDLKDADLLQIAADHSSPEDLGARLLAHARAHGRQPDSIDGIVVQSRLQPGQTAADAYTSWRLLPARANVETAAFQRLVFDGTGDYRGPADATPFGLGQVAGRPVKAYPRLDELLALLGSTASADALKANHEDAFTGYAEARSDAAALLAGAEGLDAAHLLLIRRGLDEQDSPERRTALKAFWTWQRYLEVLYAKQSNTLIGKELTLEPRRPGALLEPATELYRAIAKLTAAQAVQGDDQRWRTFGKLMERIVQASIHADQGLTPTTETERLLNRIDRQLLALAGRGDTPIVVDIHTHAAEGQVVEEAVGWAVQVEQEQARGARFSHYEFKQPMVQRLTDAAWQQRLASGSMTNPIQYRQQQTPDPK
jgi:hypothetical protein